MPTQWSVFTIVMIVASSVLSAAREDESVQAAREIIAFLDERNLQAAAAEHADAAGTFSAVLYIPGVQLLGITSTYPVAERMRQILAGGDHRHAYAELQALGGGDGRVFVQDVRANGLRPGSGDGELSDVVFSGVGQEIAYDGEWSRQRMSPAEYRDAFARDEERYTRLLRMVLAGMQQRGLSPSRLTRSGPSNVASDARGDTASR